MITEKIKGSRKVMEYDSNITFTSIDHYYPRLKSEYPYPSHEPYDQRLYTFYQKIEKIFPHLTPSFDIEFLPGKVIFSAGHGDKSEKIVVPLEKRVKDLFNSTNIEKATQGVQPREEFIIQLQRKKPKIIFQSGSETDHPCGDNLFSLNTYIRHFAFIDDEGTVFRYQEVTNSEKDLVGKAIGARTTKNQGDIVVADSGRAYLIIGETYTDFKDKAPAETVPRYLAALTTMFDPQKASVYYLKYSYEARVIASKEDISLVALIGERDLSDMLNSLGEKGYKAQNLCERLPFLVELEPFLSVSANKRDRPEYREPIGI